MLDRCRQRVQQTTTRHRGRSGDPLHGICRILHAGHNLPVNRQRARIDAVFAVEDHTEVEITWVFYQHTVTVYRDKDREHGRRDLSTVITLLHRGVSAVPAELRCLGRTFNRRTADVLAYFDLPGTRNGPTETINGRLVHLRGIARGFRNLTNYIARSLLDAGGFRHLIHPLL